MSVVQRCPNCGTTKATSGECEACHEAEVRYFCTNHTPGLWLEASTCTACGARFGEPARSVAPPPAVPARTRSPSRAPAKPVATRSPAPVRVRRERSRPAVGEPGASPMALLQKILQAAIRARHLAPAPARRSTVGRGAGGCLLRLLLVAGLLLLALASAVFLFGQALLQGY